MLLSFDFKFCGLFFTGNFSVKIIHPVTYNSSYSIFHSFCKILTAEKLRRKAQHDSATNQKSYSLSKHIYPSIQHRFQSNFIQCKIVSLENYRPVLTSFSCKIVIAIETAATADPSWKIDIWVSIELTSLSKQSTCMGVTFRYSLTTVNLAYLV